MRVITNNLATLILTMTCLMVPAAAQPFRCPSNPPTITVTNARDLRDTLEQPNFTGTILIPSNATIDLKGHTTSLTVKSCVHIKGTRTALLS